MTAYVYENSEDAQVARDVKMVQKWIPKNVDPAKNTIIFDVVPIKNHFIFVKGKEFLVSNPFEIGLIPDCHEVADPSIFFSRTDKVLWKALSRC